MHKYFVFHKPYGYLSQFTDEGRWKGLNQILELPKDVYAIGRLDADSEGLLLLSNDTSINMKLLHPSRGHQRIYHVQVEGGIKREDMEPLRKGIELNIKGKKHLCQPIDAELLNDYHREDRDPPIRVRKAIPDSWIELVLSEGKNRQVRKMTAAIGFPTLRLVRYSMENITLDLVPKPGDIQELEEVEFKKLLRLI